VVAIFHELDMVRDLFPRVILMKGGRIVADGAPNEVLSAARVAEAWGIDEGRARRLGAGS
jgi:ABC-type branched-subunit amino acid transport system ATPase component